MLLGDAESTGVDPHRDRIVTFCLIEGGPGHKPLAHNWLIATDVDISEGAAKVHGITTEHARTHGRPAATAIREIADHILSATGTGIPFIAYNAPFDLTMLWAETRRHCPDLSEPLARVAPVIDPFVLDKWVDRYRKGSRKLIDTARHYGINLTEDDAHGAEADARAAGNVAWAIANRHAGATGNAMDVHRICVEQKRIQGDSFGAYLIKKGDRDDAVRDFPIVPPPADWSPDQLPQPREEAA
jgi:DNA polymerase-3 subunit epsilon